MRLIYSIGINIASCVIKVFALFNPKLKLGVLGRTETFAKLKKEIKSSDKTFWFHCASLGEYEQGLPVFEALKAEHPNYKIILSFFSPSGYEVRKNAKIADTVVYLPLDTKSNAKRFLDIINPDYIIFVKYEIWPNYLLEIKKRELKAILISAVFRKDQSFFKWYGGMMKSSLFAFKHIFTQDENSKTLLNTVEYTDVTVSGDTRFDRVYNQLKLDNKVPFIENFKADKFCVIFGSTWPEDDKLFIEYINKSQNKDVKFIIAPHNINANYTASLKSQLYLKTICYSEFNNQNLSDYSVFILDTIGYLSKAYNYGEVAYVGGAAGTTGLHNILEPAVFGIPILIGKNYNKFPEAYTMISKGGVQSISNAESFKTLLDVFHNNVTLRQKQGDINRNYIIENRGAVVQIIDYIRI
ncbi:3-deoxy-D-manno-octulosonic acid transferase [Winogradskyella sp. PE311]|uniref:3-deoxy-D-manno-octulosonic acid transferase n=1 Tax=Winogradskyella sp. PE311 TaxID=3366943 RepID=UPI0039806643